MTTEQNFRDKVHILSFVLCSGVVLQHTQWLYKKSGLMNGVHDFLFFIVTACVPFFFMLSGYLFFRTYSSKKWKEKLISRLHTLLIPYLIWNAIYVVFMMIMGMLNVINHPIKLDGLGGVFDCGLTQRPARCGSLSI